MDDPLKTQNELSLGMQPLPVALDRRPRERTLRSRRQRQQSPERGPLATDPKPVARGQQFFRKAPGVNDTLPATDTQRLDFGLNYYPTPSLRLNASYGRQFTDLRDANYWTADITYHFLFPMAFWLKESK